MLHTLKSKFAIHLVVAALFCITLYCLGIYCRPIFPVDETRYLTVAWEMFSSGEYILPHLNSEAYDHKPPMLFWAINLLWSIFGVSQEVAMAAPFLFGFAFICATQRFAKHLRPDDKYFPALVTYILIGSLPFIIYSNMIMFDLLLGVFSVLALTAVWDYSKSGDKKHLYLFALFIGLGAITKGPVILLHTLFPIVFAKLWTQDINRKQWVSGFTLAILGGIMLALCWAIPAAIKGGPEFANKIFWGQTAGRMTNAFDHKQPFFWYLPFLPVVLLPWLFSPLLWRGLRTLKTSPHKNILRFIYIWVLPVFLCFCFISGKQVHYLLPLIPGFAIFVALVFRQISDDMRPRDAIIPFAVTGFLILTPLFMKLLLPYYDFTTDRPLLVDILRHVSLSIPIVLFAASAILTFILNRRHCLTSHVLAISVSCLMVMVCFQMESRDGLFKNYDLRPIAAIVQKNPDAPLAFARNYHGEWGFLARLNRPVLQLEPEDLPAWFEKNPYGMAFMRTGHPEELIPYDTIFSMPYKMDNTYNIVVKRGQAARFVK